MKRKLNEEYRFNITPEDIRDMMADEAPVGSDGIEVIIPWELYDENRDMIDSIFHVEFEEGDRPETSVRILEKGEMYESSGLNEGGVPFEETRDGEIYLQEVYEYLDEFKEQYDLSIDMVDLMSNENEIIYDNWTSDIPAEECAEMLLKMSMGPESWNIMTMQSGANDVYEQSRALSVKDSLLI